mmetsp:Transcript_44899/g.116360  ORF Transcript_44899/g.116360 Transcript_44899/m.116360 type:complete len:201 (+) Transcript_44899:745-1347(+)
MGGTIEYLALTATLTVLHRANEGSASRAWRKTGEADDHLDEESQQRNHHGRREDCKASRPCRRFHLAIEFRRRIRKAIGHPLKRVPEAFDVWQAIRLLWKVCNLRAWIKAATTTRFESRRGTLGKLRSHVCEELVRRQLHHTRERVPDPLGEQVRGLDGQQHTRHEASQYHPPEQMLSVRTHRHRPMHLGSVNSTQRPGC